MKESNIEWGYPGEVGIDPLEDEEDPFDITIPKTYDKDFLILIASAKESFRFYTQSEKAMTIESAIEIKEDVENITLKEFLEIYLNNTITYKTLEELVNDKEIENMKEGTNVNIETIII